MPARQCLPARQGKAGMILFFISILLLCADAGAMTESWNKENFEIIWHHSPPSGEFELYRKKVLKEKLISFSNLLDKILSRQNLPRLHIIARSFDDEAFFDRNRMEVHLPVSGDFNVENGISQLNRIFNFKEDVSSKKDYFGVPCKFGDGFLFSFHRRGKFYLSFESEKEFNLLLEEKNLFDSVKVSGRSAIFYRLGNSLWFIDIRRKKNFCYFSIPEGFGGKSAGSVPFLKAFDCDGKSIVICVGIGEKSNVILGKINQNPDIFFQDLPYKIEKIFINGETIIFFAALDSGKKVIGIGSKRFKKISKIYSYEKDVFPVGKYRKGMLVFSPAAERLEYIDARRSVLLTSNIKVKTVADETGVNYLAVIKDGSVNKEVEEILLTAAADNILFLKDSNRLNFILKNLEKNDFYSFHPVSSKEYLLLEIKDYLRRFIRYEVEGLLSQEQVLFDLRNRRRKVSLGILIFFLILLISLKIKTKIECRARL